MSYKSRMGKQREMGKYLICIVLILREDYTVTVP